MSATVAPSVASSVFSSEVPSVPPSVFSSYQQSPLPGPSDLPGRLRQILNISYIRNKNHDPSLHACFERYLQVQRAYAISNETDWQSHGFARAPTRVQLTELIIGHSAYANYMQVFPTIVIKYSQMVSWLNKDVDAESDLMVWGKEQSSYTFADLK